ncbi:MAG: UDP-N-acetylglucosamine--N-acetylmuramyl-(pentapeptide) pyrophosphoryl-undecaprenol N-acetylglucosamine transferase [bacterium]|nr:UDP-N-acetylglucosamine--N-acetylmuramyl-(pentapeptide) pyrophosphoryl-undecaprenol N-acetylglucosamine transferase [bacterium]
MTIVFTGGGTGGHFYPLIAIAEAMQDIVREKRLVAPRLYFLSSNPFDAQSLFENSIVFIRVRAGKWRRYFSISNFTDLFATLAGFFTALITLFRLYPDVVVSKGGYTSVPVMLAARILGIPVVIHESDAKPGRANLFAGRFAKRIAISYEEAAHYFPKKVQGRIARTGIPVRKELLHPEIAGAREELKLEPGIPTVLVLGGSLGAKRINDTLVSALPDMVAWGNVIHQTGTGNYTEVEGIAKVALEKSPHKERYHPFPYLSALSLRRAAGVADVVISRAGSGTITEISIWKKPAILVPIPEAVSHDQRTNAYAFARTGGAVVLEESNLTPHLLVSEARRIAGNPELAKSMGEKGATFASPDAAKILAEAILGIALSHES